MKTKKERGITLTMLVITIVILAIIVSITVYVGSNMIEKTNLQNLNTNMLLIQAKVKTIGEDSKFNKNEATLKGQKVSQVTQNQKIEELVNSQIIDTPDTYYLLSQEDLNTMGLEKIQIEEGYVVNYETAEIIYVKGFEANKTTYYKLSETKGLTIE